MLIVIGRPLLFTSSLFSKWSDSFVPASREAQARTRAFARVLGPWLAIVPGIIALRAPAMGALASDFFKSDLFVWFAARCCCSAAC